MGCSCTDGSGHGVAAGTACRLRFHQPPLFFWRSVGYCHASAMQEANDVCLDTSPPPPPPPPPPSPYRPSYFQQKLPKLVFKCEDDEVADE